MSVTKTDSFDEVHLKYLSEALEKARLSPPKPTNFRVGCILVSNESSLSPRVISSGFTLELPGNTHAEQCALAKLASSHSVLEDALPLVLAPSLNVTLYTTLEPCGKRLSGNIPCVQRIIATRHENPDGGIRKVIFGAKEPGTFVQGSKSCRMLTEAGVEWEYIPGLQDEILRVAMEGHVTTETETKDVPKEPTHAEQAGTGQTTGTNIDDITPEERKRQEAQPRNPKKRMMEVDVNR